MLVSRSVWFLLTGQLREIVKGWLDSEGKAHEKIYDVACSDDRKITGNNRCDMNSPG